VCVRALTLTFGAFAVEVDLDAEFDPEKYDQEMQQKFDDSYYAQAVWDCRIQSFGLNLAKLRVR
jgi:hypothetical protein